MRWDESVGFEEGRGGYWRAAFGGGVLLRVGACGVGSILVDSGVYGDTDFVVLDDVDESVFVGFR